MMRNAVFSLVLALTFTLGLSIPAKPALAQEVFGPVAIVNDRAISGLDVSMRLRIAIVSSGLSDSEEVRERFSPQILQQMIDDELKLLEAEKLGLLASDAEVGEAFADLAAQNNMEPEAFRAALAGSGILPSALERQIRAGLSWQAIMFEKVRQSVQVSRDEVDSMIRQLQQREGQEQVRLYEIFLPHDFAGTRASTMEAATRLAQQMNAGEAPFSAVAQQFSQAPTASVGGDMGWLFISELPADIRPAITNAAAGTLVGPLDILDGVYIYALRDRRRLENTAGAFDRDRITEVLFSQKMEAASRRYLRDLRNASYIQIRN